MSENIDLGKKPVRPNGHKPAPNAPKPVRKGAPRPAGKKQGQAPRKGQGAPAGAAGRVPNGAPVRSTAAEPVIRSGENPAQRQQPPRNGQPQRRPPQQRPAQRPPMQRRAPEPQATESFGATIRGIIAVAVTCFIVCVIVIMFSNSLFVSDAELQKTAKTGHLTETAFEVIEPKQQLRDEVVTTKATKKKKTTTADEDDEPEDTGDLPEGLDTSIAGDYTVNSPVYLHPIADANSANLATLPFGEEIRVLGQSFGWYYVEYDGQKGYAWGTFFTKK